MFFLFVVLCYIETCYASYERTVQCIIGRNVSFSLTFSNINKDALVIFHDLSPLLDVWPTKNQIFPYVHDDRLEFVVDKSTYNAVSVIISIMNVTENDNGIYKMERYMGSEEVIDSVIVQTFATYPWIAMVPHRISDYTIVLQCRSSTVSTGNFIWKLNGSLIESRSRYSQNISLLSIRNVTSDDKYNLYTCQEYGTGPESDPFKLNISGPYFIHFSPNVTVVQEYERLSISCLADCYPICMWNWFRLNNSSALDKSISTDSDIQLNNITRKDAGTYLCKVYNIITNTSFEDATHLDVVFGPDEIYTNISDTTIEMNEFDTVAILCYADCFPPCQISWTETNKRIVRSDSELKLSNVENDVNYTCHATNPRKSNSIISRMIYIKVKSVTNYSKTTGMIPEGPEEDFPSTHHFLFVTLAAGLILAIALFACLMQKCRSSSNLRRTSNCTPVTNSNNDGRDNSLEEETQSTHYWTIVRDKRGEMRTALDTDINQSDMTTPKGQMKVPKQSKSEQTRGLIDLNADTELDDYLDPIQSGAEGHNEYIHPIRSVPVNTDLLS